MTDEVALLIWDDGETNLYMYELAVGSEVAQLAAASHNKYINGDEEVEAVLQLQLALLGKRPLYASTNFYYAPQEGQTVDIKNTDSWPKTERVDDYSLSNAPVLTKAYAAIYVSGMIP